MRWDAWPKATGAMHDEVRVYDLPMPGIALPQDLVVAATLGIDHVERNGHHYFRGLSGFPQADQQRMLDEHDHLYRWHDAGFATLDIHDGAISIHSITATPFG